MSCSAGVRRQQYGQIDLGVGFSTVTSARFLAGPGLTRTRETMTALELAVVGKSRTGSLTAKCGVRNRVEAHFVSEIAITAGLAAPAWYEVGHSRKRLLPLCAEIGMKGRRVSIGVLYEVGMRRSLTKPLVAVVLVNLDHCVRILGNDRLPQAVLNGVRWHYSKRLNEATEVSVYIPKEALRGELLPGKLQEYLSNDNVRHAKIASYVQIYQGRRLKASGKINSREIGSQHTTIMAYTEEILLEGNQTPAQYGRVWDNQDLADVARDLLDDWHTIRVKDQTQWINHLVESYNVDLTTEPGIVMLSKDSNGRYHSDGYIVLEFTIADIEQFKRWDRIRWAADSEGDVTTSIQYSTDGSNWSAPFDGGYPEEIGVVPSGAEEPVQYVRINLHTDDTESEDPDGNPVGTTPVVYAVELIARTQGELIPGNIPSSAGVTVKGISADYASAFEVLLNACEQVGWEFSVLDGQLSIAENLGADRSNEILLRSGTNMEVTSLGDDDEDLVNILRATGPGRGINRLEITLRDEASIAELGPYPNREPVEFEVDSLAELQDKAQDYLDAHNTPKTHFEVFVAFDHEMEPEYGLGDVVRVADPDTGIVTTARIMSETREYNDKGLSVHLDLGKAGLNLQRAMDGDQIPSRPKDPEPPTGVWARGIIDGILVGCTRPQWDDWSYTECHVSDEPAFTPSPSTLVDSGRKNRFEVKGLDPERRYYSCLIHFDARNNRSLPGKVVSAMPGQIRNVPVEYEHDNGLVSRLDMNGMFLRDPHDTDSIYAARMVMGNASSGTFIPLSWDYPPKVIVAPTALQTYTYSLGGNNHSQDNQVIETWVDNASPEGFTVGCHIIVPGDYEDWISNTGSISDYSTWTSDLSPIPCVRLRLQVRWYLSASMDAWTTYERWVDYSIRYRIEGGAWQTFGSYTSSVTVSTPWYTSGSDSGSRTRTHILTGPNGAELPRGRYQIQIVFDNTNYNISGVSPYVRSDSWSLSARNFRVQDYTEIEQGDVIYLAVEGGAISDGGDGEPEPEEGE